MSILDKVKIGNSVQVNLELSKDRFDIMILNASKNQVNQRIDTFQMNVNDLRLATLENLKLASEKVSLLNKLEDFNILFQSILK